MRALAAVIVAGALAASAGAVTPQRIAFAGVQGGKWAIYTAASDGKRTQKLTAGAGPFDSEPTWSPDGKRIAYVCRNFELCVMNADGSGKHRITTTKWPQAWTYDLDPAWSPDGRWIAFSSNPNGNYDLYAVHPDGTGKKRLTNGRRDESEPAWSPDSKYIAFDSDANGLDDIYVIDAEGSHQRRVTSSRDDEEAPSWSPDGAKLVYDRELDKEQNDLFVVSANGGRATRITKTADSEGDAAWSPDGAQILYDFDKDARLHTVRPDGTGEHRLAAPENSVLPAWQSQGGSGGPAARGPAPGRAEANAQFVAKFLAWSVAAHGTSEGSETPAGLRRNARLFRHLAALGRAAVANPPSARSRDIRGLVLHASDQFEQGATLLVKLADAVDRGQQARAQRLARQFLALVQPALNGIARAFTRTGFWKTGNYWTLSAQLQ